MVEQEKTGGAPFQQRVDAWLLACFGEEIARDPVERNHRFLEEALELVQACGCTGSEAHQLVDYTFGRPVGERGQEVGGVMNTLAALCLAYGLDMAAEGDTEVARCWEKIDRIREKQRNKPKHSPLPEARTLPPANTEADVERVVEHLPKGLIAVEQSDRDAAAPWVIVPQNQRKIREGHLDWNPMVQAFARYRLAITALSLTRPAGGEEVDAFVNRLLGHAIGLEENGRYDPAAPSGLTNADAVSYGGLLREAAAVLTKPPALPKDGEGEEAGLTDAYKSMTPLEKWETLVLNGLIGTDEPWIEDMRQSLKALASREQGPPCENCLRPVEVGQVVLPWEEPGEMHADCEHPFSLKVTRHEGEPAPVVLLGEPMVHVALSSLPVRSWEVERLREIVEKCRDKFDHYADLHRLKCTAEGDEKADRNREMADLCRAALATPQQVKEGDRG